MGLCASWAQPSPHSRMPYRHLELIAATRGICCNYSSQAETYIRWNQIGVRPIPHVIPVGRGRQNRTDKQHLPIIVLILPSPNSYYVNIVWSCLCLSLPTCYLIVLVWLCHPIPDSMLVRLNEGLEIPLQIHLDKSSNVVLISTVKAQSSSATITVRHEFTLS